MTDETRDDGTRDEETVGGKRDGEQAPAAASESSGTEASGTEASGKGEKGEPFETGGGDEQDETAAKAEAAAAAKAKAEAAAKAKAAHEAAEAAKDPWERDPQAPEWIDADADPLVESLRGSHPEAIESARSLAGDLTLEVRRDEIRDVCATLKNEEGYLLPVDICGAHYPDRDEGRFEVVYHLYNFEANRRIRLKVRTDEEQEVPSVTPVWRGANWPEREVYDMFGVRFSDHPDMTRILLWEGFNGYPLRKDFPVEGIDTGSAVYPEYYEEEAGPIAGTGTGWKVPEPPEPEEPGDTAGAGGEDGGETSST